MIYFNLANQITKHTDINFPLGILTDLSSLISQVWIRENLLGTPSDLSYIVSITVKHLPLFPRKSVGHHFGHKYVIVVAKKNLFAFSF